MMDTSNVSLLPFEYLLSSKFKELLINNVELVDFNENDEVTSQFSTGVFFYFLIEGSVEFFIQVEHEHEGLKVGKSDEKFTPIGWSGFREPYRYATTVKCMSACKLLQWKHDFLKELIHEYPEDGQVFLKFIVEQSYSMLISMKELLADNKVPVAESFLDITSYENIPKIKPHLHKEILNKSSFFEIYKGIDLKEFINISTVKSYSRGQKIYEQNEISHYFDVLITGKVAHIYKDSTLEEDLDLNIISNQGYIIGSGSFTKNKKNEVSCIALKNTHVLRIDVNRLKEYFEKNTRSGVQFYLRLLWFVSNRLRSARAKFLSSKYDGEIKAVKNLIEQNCTHLKVISELHKVPHFLSSSLTLGTALATLEKIKRDGNSLEKSLATISLDILKETVKEEEFYSGLANIYHTINQVPNNENAYNNRVLCAEKFVTLFEKIDYTVVGIENLPDQASIFIYNHLENHVFNTLPNNFQLTLDSHFISSMVLYKHYNNPGIRVVRVPKSNEFGHQSYYGKLGHIPVYTKDSEEMNWNEEERKQIRSEFYKTANEHLKNGTSIILAPEGQSFTTNTSPGLFKPGAFVLASKMELDPYIVPIAIANFDKRVNHTKFTVIIKKPFKLSEKIKDIHDRVQVDTFLKEYQQEYKSYVKEAIETSEHRDRKQMIDLINVG